MFSKAIANLALVNLISNIEHVNPARSKDLYIDDLSPERPLTGKLLSSWRTPKGEPMTEPKVASVNDRVASRI